MIFRPMPLKFKSDDKNVLHASSKEEKSLEHPNLEYTPTYTVLEEPFSATPYFDFLDSYLQGLKLESYVDYSDECIYTLVYAYDDISYFKNNRTLTKE